MKYLLSGIARCSVCGDLMWRQGSGTRKDGTRYSVYGCPAAFGPGDGRR